MISYDKKVFYVLIVVLSIIVAYKKSVAKAQPLGKTTLGTGAGSGDSGIETSDKNIGFIVGGIGGSILLTAIVMYYRNRIAGGGSRSASNYGVR